MSTKVRVLYFASLRESLGCGAEELALPDGAATVGALRDRIVARGGAWQHIETIRNLRVAVNQNMADFDAPLRDGDEVAFFPPVTGG